MKNNNLKDKQAYEKHEEKLEEKKQETQDEFGPDADNQNYDTGDIQSLEEYKKEDELKNIEDSTDELADQDFLDK